MRKLIVLMLLAGISCGAAASTKKLTDVASLNHFLEVFFGITGTDGTGVIKGTDGTGGTKGTDGTGKTRGTDGTGKP